MNISKIVIFALALLMAPALAEETDTNDSAVLPPTRALYPVPCRRMHM